MNEKDNTNSQELSYSLIFAFKNLQNPNKYNHYTILWSQDT